MDDYEIRNAKITGTMLGYEDHGILTCMIYLDYGGSGQGFGGYRLDSYDKSKDKSFGSEYGMEFIKRILDTLEIDSWEKLKGTIIKVECSHCKVKRIGHALKDQWFDPEKDLSHYLPKK